MSQTPHNLDQPTGGFETEQAKKRRIRERRALIGGATILAIATVVTLFTDLEDKIVEFVSGGPDDAEETVAGNDVPNPDDGVNEPPPPVETPEPPVAPEPPPPPRKVMAFAKGEDRQEPFETRGPNGKVVEAYAFFYHNPNGQLGAANPNDQEEIWVTGITEETFCLSPDGKLSDKLPEDKCGQMLSPVPDSKVIIDLIVDQDQLEDPELVDPREAIIDRGAVANTLHRKWKPLPGHPTVFTLCDPSGRRGDDGKPPACTPVDVPEKPQEVAANTVTP